MTQMCLISLLILIHWRNSEKFVRRKDTSKKTKDTSKKKKDRSKKKKDTSKKKTKIYHKIYIRKTSMMNDPKTSL